MSAEPLIIRPSGWSPQIEWLYPVIFVVVCVIVFVVPDSNTDRPTTLRFAAGGLASLAWIWKLIAWRALLSDDRIDYSNGYWSRGISRRDIKGYRKSRYNNGGVVIFENKDLGQKVCKLPVWIKDNSDSADWFAGLHDLDAEDAAAAEANLEADSTFGTDPESRRRRVDFLKRAAIAVAGVGIGGLFAYIWDWGRPWVILAAITGPVLALLLDYAFPQQLRFVNENGKADPRPSLLPALAYPAYGLAIFAYVELHVMDIAKWLEWSAPAAMLVLFYVLARAPALRSNLLVLAGVAVGSYAYCAGTLGFANMLFDQSVAQAYATTIQEVSEHHGRGGTSYHVTVAPWALHPETTDLTMPEDFYGRHAAGDKVCILVGSGLFGWRWYRLDECPPGA